MGILAFLLISIPLFFVINQYFFLSITNFHGDALTKNSDGLYSYHGKAPWDRQSYLDNKCGVYPELWYGKYIFTDTYQTFPEEAIIKTAKAKYKIITTNVSRAKSPTSNCKVVYDVEVYRNNQLIDKINFDHTPNQCSDLPATTIEKIYYDDSNQDTGIKITFGIRTESAGSQYCGGPTSYVVHRYDILYPEELVHFNIKKTEKNSDTLSIKLEAKSNYYSSLKGLIGINFITPTILGDKIITKTIEGTLTHNPKTFSFEIPIYKEGEIKVQPFVEAKPSTTGFYNIYGQSIFGELIYKDTDKYSAQVPIAEASYYSTYNLGTIKGNLSTILTEQNQIKDIYVNVTIDCNTISCPSGYVCQEDSGLCVKTIYKYKTCVELGCPEGFECDKNSGVCIQLTPWYKEWWVWVVGISFIIVSIFGIAYWRRR